MGHGNVYEEFKKYINSKTPQGKAGKEAYGWTYQVKYNGRVTWGLPLLAS